jgi:hypothetical protein
MIELYEAGEAPRYQYKFLRQIDPCYLARAFRGKVAGGTTEAAANVKQASFRVQFHPSGRLLRRGESADVKFVHWGQIRWRKSFRVLT